MGTFGGGGAVGVTNAGWGHTWGCQGGGDKYGTGGGGTRGVGNTWEWVIGVMGYWGGGDMGVGNVGVGYWGAGRLLGGGNTHGGGLLG